MDLNLDKCIFRTIALILFSFGAVFSGPVPAHAQKILQTYDKPMPAIEPMDAAAFTQSTVLHEDIPYKDQSLAYSVRLPKDWTADSTATADLLGLTNKVLTEIVRYYSPPRGDAERSYFSLQALNLDYQTTALQWFLPWAQERGLTLEGLHTYKDGHVEAMYVALEGDTTYAIRMLAYVNGKHMIVAEYYVPSEVWEQEKKIQSAVMASFHLKTTHDGPIEDSSSYIFPGVLSLSYPQSWKLQATPIRSAEHMSARLINQGVAVLDEDGREVTNTLNGQLDINLVAKSVVKTLPDEIEHFKNDLQTTGLVLNDTIKQHNAYRMAKSIDPAFMEVYKADDAGRKLVGYELWLAVISCGDYYGFITLLTPSRDDDYTIWSRNSETFKLILESLKPDTSQPVFKPEEPQPE